MERGLPMQVSHVCVSTSAHFVHLKRRVGGGLHFVFSHCVNFRLIRQFNIDVNHKIIKKISEIADGIKSERSENIEQFLERKASPSSKICNN